MARRTLLAFILVLLVGLGLWALLRNKPASPTPSTPVEAQSQTAPQEVPQKATPSISTTPTPVPRAARAHSNTGHIVEGVLISPEVTRYVQNVLADPQYDWKQPINFYGKVVDENNQPVEGASADFSWTDLSPNGTSKTTQRAIQTPIGLLVQPGLINRWLGPCGQTCFPIRRRKVIGVKLQILTSLALCLLASFQASATGLSETNQGLYLGVGAPFRTNEPIRFDEKLAYYPFCNTGDVMLAEASPVYSTRIKMTGPDGKEVEKTPLGQSFGSKFDQWRKSQRYPSWGDLRLRPVSGLPWRRAALRQGAIRYARTWHIHTGCSNADVPRGCAAQHKRSDPQPYSVLPRKDQSRETSTAHCGVNLARQPYHSRCQRFCERWNNFSTTNASQE